jgi:ribosomal protein L7/L12
MRLSHFVQIAKIAQRHGMKNVVKAIEADLLEAFRSTIGSEVKQEKRAIYNDPYDGSSYSWPLPNNEEMRNIPNQKLDAIKSYRDRTGCSLMQAKNIVLDYAVELGIYHTHMPSGRCKFE